MSTVDRVRQIREEAQAAVREQALVIEDVAVTPAGKRRLVRICVDRDLSDLAAGDDHSRVEAVTLDEVADATRAVSAALDESDAMGAAPYVLEVSSPGVDRPLTEPRHFRRNVTRLVALTRRDGAEVEGRLQAAGPDTIIVAVQDGRTTPGPHLQIPYADIARARVQVEFARGTDEEDH